MLSKESNISQGREVLLQLRRCLLQRWYCSGQLLSSRKDWSLKMLLDLLQVNDCLPLGTTHMNTEEIFIGETCYCKASILSTCKLDERKYILRTNHLQNISARHFFFFLIWKTKM